ncbi:glycine/sarcosine/betaine reductase selenoprotein B family protein [Rhabdothermincola salaria]|uniref:glycine/sarcosine/betaine reductase selenoprotein B family protein n=1 Tax=Rhabdothermincola salaria TaxID=2903142 RepID=UPI001E34E7CA|nr:glycine/sarcosine/betaine reductase selenoprotein B family protein [Rhabdothermincola salaria]MCD9622918.1 glycine/betaine/sarcosine/D-proline family reductase selenoprotein B [Rhabdothermincola salaria]
MSDAASRAYAAGLPNPEFATTARTEPKALSQATVAIVTTAAIHHPGDEGFSFDDTGFRVIDQDRPEVVMGHWSPNFDHAGFAADPEVVLPRARLAELADEGVIGRVAARHVSFAGNQEDTVTRIRLDSGPAAGELLRGDGVDVVVLTPV